MSEAQVIAPPLTPPADASTTAPTTATVDNTAAPTQAPTEANTEGAKLWSEPPKEDAKPTDAQAPEWFMKDKYKTVDDQAKAHYDLQKLMGKNWGAPKDDYSIDGVEGVVANDPLLDHLKPKLKELGLSQDGFVNLVKSYQEANIAMADKIAKEVAETLTKTEHMTVQAVDKWLQSAFNEGDRKIIQSWIMSVDDFKALNSLRLMLPATSSVPSSTNSQAIKFESTKEVDNEKVKYRKEVNEGHRVADKNYENELQQRWRDAYQREDRTKK